MRSRPSILIVSAEFWPIAKTGGLGDMVYSIATSVRDYELDVTVLVPGYRSTRSMLPRPARCDEPFTAFGWDITLETHLFHDMRLVVVRCDELFDRPGGIYLQEDGRPWPDNSIRFGLFCKVAATVANGVTTIPQPDLISLHDWHTALTPVYLEPGLKTQTVLTIHNFMYQGRFDCSVVSDLEIGGRGDVIDAACLFGGFSFLQAGLSMCTALTTTAPSYVADIRKQNRHNRHYLKAADLERLHPVLNWPEFDVWNPATDRMIAAPFDERSIASRAINRRALEGLMGWDESDAPIFCTVSRITRAKGFRFLLEQVDTLLAKGARLLFVGDGDRRLINRMRNVAQAHPDQVGLITPYSEQGARQALAGADFLLMPSLTEPCGLSQQHAQLYGCVPVASMAGGIRDTIEDGRTGFLFHPSDRRSFNAAVERALTARADNDWIELQRRAMIAQIDRPQRRHYGDLFMQLLDSPFHDVTSTLMSAPLMSAE